MSLFIRDDEVDALARQVQKATNARSKTEAVRTALRHELERAGKPIPLRDRVRKFQVMARQMGPDSQDFDMKNFMDKMWKEG